MWPMAWGVALGSAFLSVSRGRGASRQSSWVACWPGARGWHAPPGRRSGQDPGLVLDGEAHREESAQVEAGDSVVETVVVLLDASVRHPSGTTGEPGNRAFDHRQVLGVTGLNAVFARWFAVLAVGLVFIN